MPKFYFLASSFSANSATSSRYLGYLKGLEEMKVDTYVYFFWPDNNRNKIHEHFSHIKVTYLWEHFYISNKYIKHLSYLLYVLIIFLKLRKGDKVYTYGLADLLPILMKRKGVEFYHERTEIPTEGSLGGKILHVSMGNYYKYCAKLKGLIVISTYLKQHFIDRGVDESKISIINIIVDPKRFVGLKRDESVEPYFVYCGTVENAVDGVSQLIKAFSIVAQKYPEVKLYIAGRAPYKRDVLENEALIKEYGLQEKVVFKGVVSAEKVPQMLVNAKAVTLDRPDSIMAKAGFPTKLGEYLLSKTPTVITRIGDIPLFIKDRENALLAEESNPEDFARQLIWVLEHPEKASIIGDKGAELALNSFSYRGESKKLKEAIFK